MNAMVWAIANLRTLGDFDAFVLGDRVWRSRASCDQAARMAAGLVAMDVAPGDRVLLWLPNGPELTMAWRAVLHAGAVAVLAHHDAPLRRIEDLAADTAPTAIVTSTSRLPPDAIVPTVRHRIQTEPDEERPGWRTIERMFTEHEPLAEPVPRLDRDVATIVYTSGTTGTPKGIVTRHGALTNLLKSRRRRFERWRRPVRNLAVLPMSSAFGSPALYEGLGRKSTLYFLDRFDPQRVLETIENRRIRSVVLVPTMCEAILAVPNASDFDLSSLHTVLCGGAQVTPDLMQRFREVFGIRILVAYGMSGIGGVSRLGSSSKPGSVGQLASGLKARVIDAEGREVPAGEVGELVIRRRGGSAVEYWNPDLSVTSLTDSEGWLRTGDLVRVDPDGEMYVAGRGDDLIIQGGHKIHARTVAELVERLAGIRECAVVGVPSDYFGQEAVACVALQDGARLTARDIIAHCKDNLEARAVPRSVWFVDALPRNESGKVMGHALLASIRAARGSVFDTDLVRRLANEPAATCSKVLQREVRRLLGEVVCATDRMDATSVATFRDMGLDSLGAVELVHGLSLAIGRPVPETLTYTHPTIDAACAFIQELLGFEPMAAHETSVAIPPPPAGAEAIRLEQFITAGDLDVARRAAPAPRPARDAQVVFLTGANGFLGRFLTLEILRRIPGEGGKLYCLVRAPNPTAALERLRTAYASDPNLLALFERLSSNGRLAVLGGDLTQPRFGLSEADYARLCGEVDCIVHNGAMVDHVLGFPELFAPNVLGTVEIIRLALEQRRKSINYVSTIAVASIAGKASSPAYTGVAAGYCSSKWASERLLKDLRGRIDIPVRIYRPSQILAHSEYRGQINVQDAFTRLFQGIITTALAPGSFYVGKRRRKDTPFDGLPVDVVARSIAVLSMAGDLDRPGWIEYHVVNPHREVDLDTIIDWVETAGYPLGRIEDYSAWYQAFRNRLSTLERSKRRQSLLPLIHAWKHPMRHAGARYDTTSLHGHLAQLAGRDASEDLADMPSINEPFVHKCLMDMCALGLIDPAR